MGGDRYNLKGIGTLKLRRLGDRRTGHAGQLVVHAEVVLEGDRGEGLVFLFDLDALFGLHCLVKTLRPAPPLKNATGELVDDLHFAVLEDVVLVPLVEFLGPQRRLELVDQVLLNRVVEVL